MANLSGNLDELTQDDGNDKRQQLAPVTPKQNRGGQRQKKDPSICYINTKLDLPEEVKRRMDIHFASNADLRKAGKNNFMIEAITQALDKLDK